MKVKPTADYLFEASYEVCNKIGGIYTVIISKASLLQKYYGDKYFLVGPYIPGEELIKFKEKIVPQKFKNIFSELKDEGIVCHYGGWRIGEKEINTILIDYKDLFNDKNLKNTIQKEFKISPARWKTSEKEGGKYRIVDLLWGVSIARLFIKIQENEKEKKIVVQLHEWLPGYAIKYLKDTKIATVFTTHATKLGRFLTGSKKDMYSILDKVNYERESEKMGISVECASEKLATKEADVFTTVSEITGIEAKKLLGRKPDILTLNGLDFNRFPVLEDRMIKHNLNKKKIKEFIEYYFFPYQKFNIKKTLIYFICGRYEFKNKGIDILIKSLSQLNDRLKKNDFKKNIVVFFWIPVPNKGIKKEIIENRIFYNGIKDFINDNLTAIQNKMIHRVVTHRGMHGVIDHDFLYELKRKSMSFTRKGKPPVSTHDLLNKNDLILENFKKFKLTNNSEDKVKVIIYPVYLNGADGLLNLEYYDAVAGCDLGIFPSYYEPWGYTPLESAALNVPTIATDLTGFGRFLNKNATKINKKGISVLKREGKKDKDVVIELTEKLYSFAKLNKSQRAEIRLNARALAYLANWDSLVLNYILAHNLALEKKKQR